MTLYLLNGGEQIALPTRPMVVRIQQAGSVVNYQLTATVAEGAPPPVAVERYGMLILPRVTSPTTVRLLPPAGTAHFPPQSVLTVLLGPDGGDPNGDYVQLSVDVSGLSASDLVTLTPGASSIMVQALGRRRDPVLPPHAELARDVARELLGVAFVAPSRAVDLIVGVDCSPSMRSFGDDGLLTAVLETFAGIASVVDPNGEVEAVLCGRHATRSSPVAIDAFAESTVKAFAQQPLVTGLRSAELDASHPSTMTYLVTDAIPADLSRRRGPLHVVLLADHRAVSAPSNGQSSRRVTPFPVDPDPLAGELRWDRGRARTVVSSLLVDYSGQEGLR